ncbi:uncharacterized protein TNCV_1755171 [Trichonephila clavipes]|nr:uncharacterized protein TNCV_1755171 [Trichonephila clavipes]
MVTPTLMSNEASIYLILAEVTVHWRAMVLSWIQISGAEDAIKKDGLDPGTVQMLSNILESLDAFRNDRLRDLEKIRLSTPSGNGTTVARVGEVSESPSNSSVSEHIRALKEGIMGHNPVKKTFGYKVTVYTSPIGENGKVLSETWLGNESDISITNFNCIVKYKRPTTRAGGVEIYQSSSDAVNIITPSMECSVSQSDIYGTIQSSVGDLCLAECVIDNG